MILELTPQQRVRGNGRILDLLGEDSWRNVYAAGELELRPPRVPTTEPHEEALDRL
jgi:hypothetical protein